MSEERVQFFLLFPAFHRANGWSDAESVTLTLRMPDGTIREIDLGTVDMGYGEAQRTALSLASEPDGWVTAQPLVKRLSVVSITAASPSGVTRITAPLCSFHRPESEKYRAPSGPKAG